MLWFFAKTSNNSVEFVSMVRMHHSPWTLRPFYRPQRGCGQGNIFTPVCHSVHREGGVSASVHAGIPPPKADTAQSRHPPRTRHTPSRADVPPRTWHPPGTRPPQADLPSGPDTPHPRPDPPTRHPRTRHPPGPDTLQTRYPLGPDIPPWTRYTTPPPHFIYIYFFFFFKFFWYFFKIFFWFFFAYHPPPPPLGKQTWAYGQRAVGTHPTGMHSLFWHLSGLIQNFTGVFEFSRNTQSWHYWHLIQMHQTIYKEYKRINFFPSS